MAFTSYGKNLYSVGSNESHQFWCDRTYKSNGSKRVVVWCHGVNSDYNLHPQGILLVERGIPVIATDLGGAATWASDTTLTRITSAWDYAKSAYGAKTDKMILWGTSMGAAAALLYAKANSSSVAAIACAIPACDPEDIRLNNRGGLTASVEAVYGAGTPVPDAKRPIQQTGSYPNIPIKMWTSINDTTALPSIAASFSAAVPSSSINSLGAQGHAYTNMNNDEAYNYIAPYV